MRVLSALKIKLSFVVRKVRKANLMTDEKMKTMKEARTSPT